MTRILRFLLTSIVALGVIGTQTVVAEQRPNWPDPLRIGTASLGGTYVIYGDGLALLINDTLRIRAVAETTGGPYHNFALVQLGHLELGMTTSGPAEQSWNGQSPVAPGEEMRDVRALFPMYRTPFQVIALARSGISSIADLTDKRVGVGPIGGTCASYWPAFFEALGVSDVQLSYANANELATHLDHGFIDAFAFCAGVPIRAFEQLAKRHDVNMFAFDDQQQAQLVEKFKVEAFLIDAGTYEGQTAPQASVAFWNFGIAHKNLPEDLVYELMKLALDDQESMKAIHPSASEMLAENIQHIHTVWLHPGAVRYYRERGLELADDLLPPEMRGQEDKPTDTVKEHEEEKAE